MPEKVETLTSMTHKEKKKPKTKKGFTTLKGVWKLVTYHLSNICDNSHNSCPCATTSHKWPSPTESHFTKTLKSSKWNHYIWNPSKVPPLISDCDLFFGDGFKIVHCIHPTGHLRHALVCMFIICSTLLWKWDSDNI